ncbi:MAG: hypothetical protein ABWW69_05400 [Pyrodictiaceae archaeon]
MTEKKSTITIRGIDRELYEELVRLARETGKSIGDLVNLSMKLLLSNIRLGLESFSKKIEEAKEAVEERIEEQESVVVSGVEELEVTARDLEAAPKPVVFRGLRRLVIGRDVPIDLFNEKVRSIIAVDEVVVPKDYPKLLVAQKCRLVKRIIEAPKGA